MVLQRVQEFKSDGLDMERFYFHSQTQSCFSQSKYDTRQPHYFNVTIKQQQKQKQRIPQKLASKSCLESIPSKTKVNTNVKETHVYYNSKKLYYNNQKKCLSSKQQNALKKKKKKKPSLLNFRACLIFKPNYQQALSKRPQVGPSSFCFILGGLYLVFAPTPFG